MAIVQHRHGPRSGPKIRCDVCTLAIGDARQGVVLWDGRRQDALPLFVHCGDCCGRLEAGNADVQFDSVPLAAWLIFLCNGCKLKWLRAGKLAVALAEVG
jgi:hypothetical protein